MRAFTKVILITALIFYYLPKSTLAQAPDTLWTKTYGGSGAEYAYSIQQTTDGGYIIAGRTASFGAGSVDAWLLKTDQLGNIIWTNTFGGSGDDWGRSVQQTSDGGYILTGWTQSFGPGYFAAWLIKTDPLGDSLWTKLFGGNESDYGYYIQQSSVIPGDEGYIVGGGTSSSGAGLIDAWLIKTDPMGNTTWIKTYGGSKTDYLYCVEQTSDGGYISTGWTSSFSPSYEDVYLIRTNSSGDTLWTKTYGGTESDIGRSVKQTTDGGYIIAGWTRSFGGGSNDVYLIKTDNIGNILWTKTYGGVYNEEGHSVLQTLDGGYIIAGFKQIISGNFDVWLLRTDASGNILWTKTIGGSGDDRARSLQRTSDGGYILTGWTSSFGAGFIDIWVIKIAPDLSNVQYNQDQMPEFYVLSQNYPNPFNPTTIIKYQIPELSFVTIKIFDVLGNEVAALVNEEKPAGSYGVEFDATNLPSGIYFYQLQALPTGRQAGSFVETKKMVLMK